MAQAAGMCLLLECDPLLHRVVPLIAFSALRVYAIGNRSYLWASVVFALGIVPVAVGLVKFHGMPLSFFINELIIYAANPHYHGGCI